MAYFSSLTQWLFTILGLLLAALYLKFLWAFKYWTRKNIPQLKPSIPFGDMKPVTLRQIPESNYYELLYPELKKMGPLVGLYNTFNPFLLVTDISFVNIILATECRTHFLDRPLVANFSVDQTFHSLFFMNGDVWAKRRSFFNPFFTPSRLRKSFPLLLRNLNSVFPVLEGYVGKDIEIDEVIRLITVDVIMTTLYNIKTDTFENPKSKFPEYGGNHIYMSKGTAMKMLLYSLIPKLYTKMKWHVFPKESWLFFKNLVREAAQERKQLGDDLLGFALKAIANPPQGEEGFNMTLDEVTSHVYAFLVAGFDSSALCISYTLYELGENQEIQERLRKEVQDVLDANNGELTYDNLNDMTFMSQIISETLRKYPIVGVLKRTCIKDYTFPNGFKVSKGEEIVIPVACFHHNPEYFPDPNKFDPDRFSSERKESINPKAYIPFGKGPRFCIGLKFGEMHMKADIARIVTNYRILPSAKMVPIKLDPWTIIVTAKTKSGLWIKLEKIEKST